MISGSSSCNFSNNHLLQMYPAANQDVASAFLEPSSSSELSHSNSLLYNLSILREKVNQVQSFVSFLVSPDHDNNHPQSQQNPELNSIANNMAISIQEIIVIASSMMFTWQQMAPTCQENQPGGQGFLLPGENLDWCGTENNTAGYEVKRKQSSEINGCEEGNNSNSNNRSIKNRYDIVEFDASYLLAKYTHFCQICGKGFKRDANLRMHMRAHGDEYKTNAALINPMKKIDTSGNGNDINNDDDGKNSVMKVYSCPQEGCRWNQKHTKFQPLKSMICVKNHYKRSHCPKMYVCKKCNRKQFAVLSDLRTHEKHCGDVKWVCSCGTTFSRKDKLMGHVALFVGHSQAVTTFTNPTKMETHQIQLD